MTTITLPKEEYDEMVQWVREAQDVIENHTIYVTTCDYSFVRGHRKIGVYSKDEAITAAIKTAIEYKDVEIIALYKQIETLEMQLKQSFWQKLFHKG